MNAVLLLTVLALALPAFAEEAVVTKKQDKRGLLGLGYGGYAGDYYDGLGHTGYNRYVSPHNYGYGHGAATIPASSHGYVLPPVYSLGYSGYNTPLYPTAYRPFGYSGLGNIGNLGHGVNYLHGY